MATLFWPDKRSKIEASSMARPVLPDAVQPTTQMGPICI